MGVILDILLVILKVIGYTLLGILGLILLMIILLLFVPIRYEGYVSYKDEFVLKGRVSYLLRFISARFSMENGKTDMSLRIGPYKPKESDNSSKSGKKKRRNKGRKQRKKKNPEVKAKASEEKTELVSADPDSFFSETERKAVESEKKDIINVTELPELSADSVEAKSEPSDMQKDEKPQVPLDNAESKDNNEDKENTANKSNIENKDRKKNKRNKKKKGGLREKIKNLKEKLSSIKERFNRPKKEESKLSKIKRFLADETNKRAIRTVYGAFKKLLKHILPQKIRGYVRFGTSDPGTTGKVLGVLGIFYAKYGKSLRIYPDFENQVIEAELRIKGRIRLFTLARIGLKAYLNKDVKYLINQIKNFK